MNLDGDQRKKRRTGNHADMGQQCDQEGVEDDVSEEEKMEAFFDLIQVARGAREQLFGRKQAEGEEDKLRQPARPRGWNPAFQPCDFVDNPGKDMEKVPGVTCGPSHSETKPDEGGREKGEDDEGRMKREGEGDDGGVNLKLSLGDPSEILPGPCCMFG